MYAHSVGDRDRVADRDPKSSDRDLKKKDRDRKFFGLQSVGRSQSELQSIAMDCLKINNFSVFY
jgi:hypothetical protein